MVEPVLRNDVAELLHEVHLQCAADATVLQRNETVVAFAHDAALLYECRVDVHFAYVIYYDGESDTFSVAQNTVEQRCLSAS